MLRAFLLAIGQIGDRAFAAVFLKSLAVTVALLTAAGGGLWYGATRLAAWLGWGTQMGGLLGAMALLAAFGLGWLLFRVIAIGVMGVFADDIVIAVEAKHYPSALATARTVPLTRGIALGVRSALRAILINMRAPPCSWFPCSTCSRRSSARRWPPICSMRGETHETSWRFDGGPARHRLRDHWDTSAQHGAPTAHPDPDRNGRA